VISHHSKKKKEHFSAEAPALHCAAFNNQIQHRVVGSLARHVVGTMHRCHPETTRTTRAPMTIALLIALAGSLAAMAVIVRRLEQR
jgi:hypothetical protein